MADATIIHTGLYELPWIPEQFIMDLSALCYLIDSSFPPLDLAC